MLIEDIANNQRIFLMKFLPLSEETSYLNHIVLLKKIQVKQLI